jgi:quercetin dioxygenase-like cupin family protein
VAPAVARSTAPLRTRDYCDLDGLFVNTSGGAMSVETTSPRRGISIFRAEQATPLLETDFMTMPDMNSELVEAGAPEIYMASAPGTDVRVAVRQTPEEGGFSILHVWFKADYPVPRHTHDADCMYYIVSGSVIMGAQTLRTGDGFFVPTGAPYGYTAGPEGVELLEIRHGVTQFDIEILESSASKWGAIADTIAIRREEWEADTVSPTLVTNRAAAAAMA